MESNNNNIDGAQYFRGYAKLKLDHLTYQDTSAIGTRTLDVHNVKRLVKVFETEGCNRLEPEHYIPAKISDEHLSQSLSRSGIAPEQLLQPSQPPSLEFERGIQLICARGKHRLEACHQFGEDWWVVELYTQSMPQELWVQLCEKSSNEQCFGDGDIYRAFRHYQLLGNRSRAQQWLNRIGSTEKQKNIRRIQSKPTICRGFDRLLPYGGLWKKFSIDNFRTVLDLGHHQQVTHYLIRIHDLWSGILPETQCGLLDAASVRFLQGRMPKYSQVDQQHISQAMDSRELFSSVTDEESRRNLRGRLENIGRFVSIQIMIEDLNFLTPCTTALRRLLPKGSRTTIYETLMDKFRTNALGIRIQTSEDRFSWLTIPGDSQQIALVQLWLYTWRHILRPFPTNVEKKKQVHWDFDIHALKGLASLAKHIGFHSNTIDDIAGIDATEIYADEILKSFRDQAITEGGSRFSQAKSHLVEGLQVLLSTGDSLIDERPIFTTDHSPNRAKTWLKSSQMEYSHQTRSHLFLKDICGPDQACSQYATALAVLREILFSFFNRAMLLDIASQITTDDPDSDHTADEFEASIPREQDYQQFRALLQDTQGTESDEHPDAQSDSQSEYSRSPVDLESHTSDVILAPGFEDSHSVGPLEKRLPINLHRGATEVINIWEHFSNEHLVVFYFFEDGEYIKFHRRDRDALKGIFKTLLQDHDMLAFYRGDFQLLNNYLEDAIHYQLILTAKKDGFAQGRDPYEYVSRWIKPTGKRAANESEDQSKRQRAE